MIDLSELIRQANELEPLPASTVRLAQMVSSACCHIDDVAELIAFDQGLTVKLLRAANSAASASATKIGTAKEAVTRLGTSIVLSLAVAGSARPILNQRIPAYNLDEGALWRHSVAAAVAVEASQQFCEVNVPPETFTSALLHDVGKLVMGRFINPSILAFLRRAQEVDHLSALDAEVMILDVHHGELGGLVAQHWQLPPRVVSGIIYHHHPEEGGDVICDLTYLANQVAKRLEADLDGREFELTVAPGISRRLGLTPTTLEQLCAAAAARYAQVSCRYNSV